MLPTLELLIVFLQHQAKSGMQKHKNQKGHGLAMWI